MKNPDLPSPAGYRTIRTIAAMTFLICITACSMHRPAAMDPENLPEILRAEHNIPENFKGRAILTLPDSLPPGGSLQLAYAVSLNRGLRMAVLTPMGAPFLEMTAAPGHVHIRDMESGKLQRANSLEALTRRLLGIHLDMNELSLLLSGEVPLPEWTAVVSEGPSTFLLMNGRRAQARLFLDTRGDLLRLERLQRNHVVYTLTSLHTKPRIWQIENKEHSLRLRIRHVESASPMDTSLFRLSLLPPSSLKKLQQASL
ncbi:outer membrane lipoprotein LolB [Desulfobotulus mexicanus]|uniref:Outer membrane lipoprotein LolB n=1 Tax=Desulfobotulus mexicanus TaxID=2586642 RepID=A0A5S5ME42_9BACT|nr:outer membrane lipoprotein LolB [Desulfobotulus mexicanus]TYT73959.1 outer membrane lipoprotein LolB [Desulfobotulus mexicanus]